jgi:hypothetical protein
VGNPILDADTFRRDLPEARELEKALGAQFFDPTEILKIAQGAGLPLGAFNPNVATSKLWADVLDAASAQQTLPDLVTRLEEEKLNARVTKAIARVRDVEKAGGSLQPTRLLLDGGRPFLGRSNLRAVLPELKGWGAASILVVRGAADSGRTETHVFLADRTTDKLVFVDESRPLKSSMHDIWKAAGAHGPVPADDAEALTTESAALGDYWTDVKEALESANRRLWVVIDDLDKGAGRLEVRILADVLATRLKDVTFQKRLRLVLIGYPEAELPEKVSPALVREDKTDDLLDETHVMAFFDYCLSATGKQLSDDRGQLAKKVCDAARARPKLSFVEALNLELSSWYRGLG